jgi:hypothetical protein
LHKNYLKIERKEVNNENPIFTSRAKINFSHAKPENSLDSRVGIIDAQ